MSPCGKKLMPDQPDVAERVLKIDPGFPSPARLPAKTVGDECECSGTVIFLSAVYCTLEPPQDASFFPQSVVMTGRAVEADMPLGRRRQHSHRDRIGTSFEAVKHPTDQRDRHAAIGHLSRQART
jgi:hypothetical protein